MANPGIADASVARTAAPVIEAAKADQRQGKELTLPSGRLAFVRRGTGRDILRASRMVDLQAEGQMGLLLATVAAKVTIDGQVLTYEDVLEMDDEDVWKLMAAVQGKGDVLPRST